MRERRRNTASSASYTGFRAVEGFQYPGVWKKAGQSLGSLLLICGVAVFAAAVRRLAVNGFDCSGTCSLQTCIDVAAVATSLTDVLLHLLLLVSLHKHWPAGTVTVVVWNALKGAAAVYLLVHFTYQLQTRGAAALVLEHYMGMVALVPAQAVVLYTLAWAAHEQRSANQMDDDDLP